MAFHWLPFGCGGVLDDNSYMPLKLPPPPPPSVWLPYALPYSRADDPISFPSPPAEAAAWQVQDENTGKPVDIPRPVRAIRVWDAAVKVFLTWALF